jgi:hypothetical protein
VHEQAPLADAAAGRQRGLDDVGGEDRIGLLDGCELPYVDR